MTAWRTDVYRQDDAAAATNGAANPSPTRAAMMRSFAASPTDRAVQRERAAGAALRRDDGSWWEKETGWPTECRQNASLRAQGPILEGDDGRVRVLDH
jgi:hypothetical protein